MALDFTSIKKIHFVGIKGVAMTALAIFVKEKGIAVTGSDVLDEFPTEQSLARVGISVLSDFTKEHIEKIKPDLVVYTGAHNGKENIEVVTAVAHGIPVMAHGKALGMFMEPYLQVSVAGSHGKTTTSAMIATILYKAGRDPSYAIGCGDIGGLGLPGHFGSGNIFVAEADEYVTDPKHDETPRFLWQHPDILVVTNIDYDHPDAYKSIDEVTSAFLTLTLQQKGSKITIVNIDDPESAPLLTHNKGTVLTFGSSEKATLKITNIRYEKGKTMFTVTRDGTIVSDLTLRIPGVHNVFNAGAAALACRQLGLSWDDIKNGMMAFEGTKRRFEFIGNKKGTLVYDDYAHHPKEIAATITGAREWFSDKRIIVVFQPHTYSRTKALLPDFVKSLALADVVVIPDIYASARETETLGMTAQYLVEEMKKLKADVVYEKDYAHVSTYLNSFIKPTDILIFMGAGDIYMWSKKFVKN